MEEPPPPKVHGHLPLASEGDGLCLSSLLTTRRSLKRSSKAKAVSASLTGWAGVQAPRGEPSPAVTPLASPVLVVWSSSVLPSMQSRLFAEVLTRGCYSPLIVYVSGLFQEVILRKPVSSAPLTDKHSNCPPHWLPGAPIFWLLYRSHCLLGLR